MRYIVPILILAVLPLTSHSQERNDDTRDNFGTWNDLIFKKDINNWYVGGYIEYCTINRFNGNGITSDELLICPNFGYNLLEWLRLQFQLDFQYCFNSGFNLRYMPEVTLHFKASDFSFSLRSRLQLTHQMSNGKLSPLMRNRLKVEYTIPKSPFSLHVAAEPYWLKSITKARYYAGMGLQIHKNISMTTEYVRYEYYNSSADQNVVSIVLYVRI